MFELLEEMLATGTLTSEFIQKQIAELKSEKNWEEFVGVKLYVLNDFLEMI